MGLGVGCQPEVPDPVCFNKNPLRSWTINGEDTSPSQSHEPNTGLNADFLYSVGLDGSFAVNVRNSQYSLLWSEPQQKLFNTEEMNTFSKEEWIAELNNRTPYSFAYQPFENDRREFWLDWETDSTTFLGDDPEEFGKGTIDMFVDEIGDCPYLVLSMDLQFINGADTLNIHFEVDQVFEW